MNFLEELHEELDRSRLETAWEDQLDGMIEEESTREDLLEWVDGLRREFLDFADVVDDPEEVREALVNRYVELQCHWQMLNTKMQYQAVNTGQPDQALMVKGSLITKLLEKMENLLGGDEVADLRDFLTDPLETLSADRVEEGKLNDFMDYVGELIVTGEMYNHLQESLADENVSEEFTQDLQSTNQAFQDLSSELQESLLEIRETPIENHLQKYPVMVRKSIGNTDKDIEVSLEGEETAVDSELIESLEGPLTALIRFFVEESVETTDRREERNKTPRAQIDLSVSRVGEDIVIELRCDGQGVDKEVVRDRGPEVGLETSEGSISDNQVLDYMFFRGLDGEEGAKNEESFIDLVDDLRGSVDLNQNDDDGIEVELTVPRTQSVIVVEGLLVESADNEFIVPLESVIESLSMKKAQRTSVEGRGEAINLRGDLFPVHDLSEVLNLPSRGKQPDDPVVMILRDEGNEYALRVDRILGQQKVVVRELGPVFSDVEYTEGSAMMGSGEICLVLDVGGLGEVVRS